MFGRMSLSTTWLMVHILFPITPFLIEGIIRYIVFDNTLSLSTFSSPTLAMSVGLICLFVSQSLSTHRNIIQDDEETESALGIAQMFNIFAIVGFVLFGILVLLTALSQVSDTLSLQIDKIKKAFDILIFFIALVPLISAYFTQRSYKLKATL